VLALLASRLDRDNEGEFDQLKRTVDLDDPLGRQATYADLPYMPSPATPGARSSTVPNQRCQRGLRRVVPEEADIVRTIFTRYLALGSPSRMRRKIGRAPARGAFFQAVGGLAPARSYTNRLPKFLAPRET
jgi:hypothetical protein